MAKQKKGLTDMEDGEFILNESGTFLSTDHVEGTENKPIHQKDKLTKSTDEKSRSSAGPEEKDCTD